MKSNVLFHSLYCYTDDMHIDYLGTHCSLEELASGLHTGAFRLGRTITLISPSKQEDNPDLYPRDENTRYMVEYTGILNGIASVHLDARHGSNEIVSYRVSIGNEIVFENQFCKVLVHKEPAR